MRGEYGNNVLKKPSLRYVVYLPTIGEIGLEFVLDEKHTIAAVKGLQVAWLDDEEREKRAWPSSLPHALDVGVDVQLLQFKEDDGDAVVWPPRGLQQGAPEFSERLGRRGGAIQEAHAGRGLRACAGAARGNLRFGASYGGVP